MSIHDPPGRMGTTGNLFPVITIPTHPNGVDDRERAARWGDGGDVETAVGGAPKSSTNGVLHVWNSVAEYLLERFEEPTLIFDRNGRIR